MNDDLYDRLWRLYYQSYFQERSSYALSKRYVMWDTLSSVLLLVATFGSLGLGLAFWNDPAWRQLWLAVTALATVISLGSLVFNVASAKQDQIGYYKDFLILRLEIEALLESMKLGQLVDETEISHATAKFNERYRSIMARTKFNFILFNRRFRRKIQNELDEILEESGYHLKREVAEEQP